jgi:hypothetical protein
MPRPSHRNASTTVGVLKVPVTRLLFLYNGPEFGDPIERAQVGINNGAFVATLIPAW